MNTEVRPIRIVPLTKTTAQWAADVASPFPTIVESGELACEIALGGVARYKGGNGMDNWASLSYLSSGGASTSGSKIITVLTANIVGGTVANNGLSDVFFLTQVNGLTSQGQTYINGVDFTQNLLTGVITFTNGSQFVNGRIILAIQ